MGEKPHAGMIPGCVAMGNVREVTDSHFDATVGIARINETIRRSILPHCAILPRDRCADSLVLRSTPWQREK